MTLSPFELMTFKRKCSYVNLVNIQDNGMVNMLNIFQGTLENMVFCINQNSAPNFNKQIEHLMKEKKNKEEILKMKLTYKQQISKLEETEKEYKDKFSSNEKKIKELKENIALVEKMMTTTMYGVEGLPYHYSFCQQ